jgi:hypothetical protein
MIRNRVFAGLVLLGLVAAAAGCRSQDTADNRVPAASETGGQAVYVADLNGL